MPPRATDIEGAVDHLFRVPLLEFVGARQDLVKRLRAEGDREGAARVKSIAKPSVSAWAINQLGWTYGRELDRLVAAGERLRAAQAAMLAGRKAADPREIMADRDEAMAVLRRRARRGSGAGRPR